MRNAALMIEVLKRTSFLLIEGVYTTHEQQYFILLVFEPGNSRANRFYLTQSINLIGYR